MIPRCFRSILHSDEGKGTPTAALSRIFDIANVPHDGTVIGMAGSAGRWRTGGFQYQIKGLMPGEVSRDFPDVLDLLGLRQARTMPAGFDWSSVSHPVDVAICGARLVAMQKRLQFAAEQLPAHLSVWLTTLGSIRSLDSDEVEAWIDLLSKSKHAESMDEWRFPTIEADLAAGLVRLLESSRGDFALMVTDYDRVCAPNRKKPADATFEELQKWRPEPGFPETIDEWLVLRNRIGIAISGSPVVMVTSQPACARYEWIARQKLPEECDVHCIGYEAPASLNSGQYLNELAMLLYECGRWLQSKEQ